MRKFLKEYLKPKAVVFVDYEYWFCSYHSKWGFRPNVSEWLKKLKEQYRIVQLEFFGDFSTPVLAEEKAYLETMADRIYDAQDMWHRRNKDTADFLMLDRIYQSVINHRNIRNYIIFTGEGNFRTVFDFLTKEKNKNVISYGVFNTYSTLLKVGATETVLVPDEEEIYLHYREYIIDNLAYCVDNSHIIPTFSGTVEAIARKRSLEGPPLRRVLSRMIEEGYIFQRDHYFSFGRKVRVLSADWDRLIAEGLFVAHDKE